MNPRCTVPKGMWWTMMWALRILQGTQDYVSLLNKERKC